MKTYYSIEDFHHKNLTLRSFINTMEHPGQVKLTETQVNKFLDNAIALLNKSKVRDDEIGYGIVQAYYNMALGGDPLRSEEDVFTLKQLAIANNDEIDTLTMNTLQNKLDDALSDCQR